MRRLFPALTGMALPTVIATGRQASSAENSCPPPSITRVKIRGLDQHTSINEKRRVHRSGIAEASVVSMPRARARRSWRRGFAIR